jgi:hypothetical protein
VVVGAHRVGLKLGLGELVHWQIGLGKYSDLDMVHIPAWLCFENAWVVENFRLRVRVSALVSSCANKLRIEHLAIESLLFAKF